MAFNSSGVYARVDNSFSNPVVGTTINPSHADTYFDDIDAALNAYRGTSTTSLAIGTGEKIFTTQTGKLFTVGRFVHIPSDADPANYMYGTVTAYSGTTLTVDVTAIGGSGTLADWTIYNSSPRGATGATGSTGSTGATGATVGVQFTYSTTTADADPGAGVFRLNNATVASATAGYFDNADAGGATVSGWLDTFDDSTNTAKGTLVARGVTSPTAWAVFNVTGSVVDGTGYRKLTLTYVAGGGTFTNGETFAFDFSRAGDKGADGAGTGDVVGPAASVDGEITLYDSTTGKLIKRATTTGLLKATSGVLAAAVSGTDYQPPATTLSGYGITDARAQGKETIGVASGGIFPATTNGCAALAQGETTTNKINYKYLAFDASAVEYAWVWFPTPKSYNASTFTMRFIWTHPSTTTNFGVVWQAEMLSLADDDALDTAVGTAVTVTDTGGTTSDFYTSSETGAITPSNTAAKQDWIAVRVSRLATNGSDTMAVDAHLMGVEIYYTTNASTDA